MENERSNRLLLGYLEDQVQVRRRSLGRFVTASKISLS